MIAIVEIEEEAIIIPTIECLERDSAMMIGIMIGLAMVEVG